MMNFSMKIFKLVSLFFVLVFLFGFTSGIDLEVEKNSKGNVVISELRNPAIFDLEIHNKGGEDNFEIYSLVGVSMSPKGTFILPAGKSTIEVQATPSESALKNQGPYYFEYYIRGQNSGTFKDNLLIQIVRLQDVFEIPTSALHPDDLFFNLSIKNTQNAKIEKVKIHFNSEFFDFTRILSFKPFENVQVPVVLDKEKLKSLNAGPYVISVEIEVENVKKQIEGIVDYLEKTGVSVRKENKGFILRETIVTKKNEGNVKSVGEILITKNILTRLFTTYSVEPDKVNRKGFFVEYVWEEELAPSESLTISMTTNYTLPFILIILIVVGGLFAKIYSQNNLVLKKSVSLVRTKGGEFALKVMINVRARKHVDSVQIIDRLPGMTKLYEKFGRRPDRIDEMTRRLFWNIDRLNAGEERMFSYIVYSKVRVLGRFEIPATMALYDCEGKTHESFSNKTFFVSETTQNK